MSGYFNINYLRKRVAGMQRDAFSLRCTESNGPYSYVPFEVILN